jgi:5-methyltetrahydropteroyltriglutamate--homocysteine methyltransferase
MQAGPTMLALPILPTTVVGSYPQPDWLIDRERLAHAVPRVRSDDLWRVGPEWLAGAQDDATLLAIRDMERAGIDIITDGEVRRESYSNHFAGALSGFDHENPATIKGRVGQAVEVPRVIGPVRRERAVEVGAVRFLRASTDRVIKMTVPGPFTMSRQAKNEHYADEEEFVLDLAAAVNEELVALKQAGADIVQIDEPWIETAPEAAARHGVMALDRALAGVAGPTVVHLCFGYSRFVSGKTGSGYAFLGPLADSNVDQISIEAAEPELDLAILADLAPKTVILGVLDLGDETVETADRVAGRIRAGLAHVPADRLVPAPDCGMKYLPRPIAFAKLKALAEGAAIVRAEIGVP